MKKCIDISLDALKENLTLSIVWKMHLVHMSLQRLFFNYKKKMSEIKFRYKFDSNAYVVDEAYFLKIERMARMNGEKMEKLAEKKFRDYL